MPNNRNTYYRGLLAKYQGSLRARINLTHFEGLEEYYKVGQRVYDMGVFVTEHFDELAPLDIERFITIYETLDRLRNFKGAIPDREENAKNAASVWNEVQTTEDFLREIYDYQSEEEKKNAETRERTLHELNREIADINFTLENCATQFVMNKNRLDEMGFGSDISVLYDRTNEYIKASLQEILFAMSNGEPLNGCIEVLRVNSVLASMMEQLLGLEKPENLTKYSGKMESVLSLLEEKRKDVSKKI